MFEYIKSELKHKNRPIIVMGGLNNGPYITNVCPKVKGIFQMNFRMVKKYSK